MSDRLDVAEMKKVAKWYHNASFGEIDASSQAVYVKGHKDGKAAALKGADDDANNQRTRPPQA